MKITIRFLYDATCMSCAEFRACILSCTDVSVYFIIIQWHARVVLVRVVQLMTRSCVFVRCIEAIMYSFSVLLSPSHNIRAFLTNALILWGGGSTS
jgi:hypothetical protein